MTRVLGLKSMNVDSKDLTTADIERIKRTYQTKSIYFTTDQLFEAKGTGVFPTHREWISHLFEKQHGCAVLAHGRLIPCMSRNTETKEWVTEMIGIVGDSISSPKA
jgi:hypothetical protein